MSTAFITESGVRPWESLHPTTDSTLTTTTLIDHNFNSVWASWRDVIEQLSTERPIKREWHSTMTSTFNSKTEEYLFKKTMTEKIGSKDLCKKNIKSNIYTTIKNLPNDPRKIEHMTFEGSHDALLIIQNNETDIKDLWSEMTVFEKGITPEKIRAFLESQGEEVVLCRFYDAETHAAVQFIYRASQENQIILETISSRFHEISIEHVHHYINGTVET